ncbi:MAG: toll/interleukin-1 receptor domain-containing protein [Bacteroidia bacterium]|nr:toll/interleukin-1 receptor domain-containing protein [Bacteroidia bacterium]
MKSKSEIKRKFERIRRPEEARVFLSHKYEDKAHCREIAAYMEDLGVNVFFDERDEDLQQAVSEKSDVQITERIKEGIRECSHMLVVISEMTYKSFWVPFEIGYGHARLIERPQLGESRDIRIAILLIDQFPKDKLPEYLRVCYALHNLNDLNEYIAQITKTPLEIIREQIQGGNQSLRAPDFVRPLRGILD